MAKPFFLFRWFTRDGWIGKLFSNKSINASVSDIAAKVVVALDSVLQYEDEVDLITSSLSDNAEASADDVIVIIKDVRNKLAEIKGLGDIAERLVDYKFSNDPITDDYIHDISTTVFSAMSDNNISPFEAAGIISRTIFFIKEKRKQ